MLALLWYLKLESINLPKRVAYCAKVHRKVVEPFRNAIWFISVSIVIKRDDRALAQGR